MPVTDVSEGFEAGAIVQLKSGGPALTVLGQAGDRVHVVFFSDEIGEFREAMLPAIGLEVLDAEEDEEDEEQEKDEDEDEDDEDEKSK
jgi:uncharacterized protein YodC (DUF2158 family)